MDKGVECSAADAPLVSILMVARNTAPFIGAAIASARAQTWHDLEIVVVDDGSTDQTRAIAERHAAVDGRVRVLDGPCAGLAAVRNLSLAAARGRWVAILDSDDLVHPDHIAQLVAAARVSGAEMVVANMIAFDDHHGRRRVRRFAAGGCWDRGHAIAIADYVRGNVIGAPVVTGYLKPLFETAFLRRHGLVYDGGLRIGEDFDLVFRAMLAGGRLHYLPEATYFYRRHAGSTSALTPAADLVALLASDAGYAVGDDAALVEALAARRRALVAALRLTEALVALKALRPMAAAVRLGGDGLAWRGLVVAMGEATAKRARRALARVGRGWPAVSGGAEYEAILVRLEQAR